MAETDLHRNEMTDAIQELQDHYSDESNIYVSGNLLLYYEEGNPRKHVSPDVLVARGVAKLPPRLYYQVWKEGKSPDVVMELTSKTTRREDQKTKLVIYRDILRIPEYFLFDPLSEYLKPSMQGYRLIDGDYVPIDPVAGRLPSQALGLHLERSGHALRFYNPATGMWLPTRLERQQAAERHAEAAERHAEAAERRTAGIEAELRRIAEENDRLRRELEALRGKN